MPAPLAPARRRPPLPRLALLTALVLAAHGLLLAGWPGAVVPEGTARAGVVGVRALQVSEVTAEAAPAVATALPVAEESPATPVSPPTPSRPTRRAVAAEPAAVAPAMPQVPWASEAGPVAAEVAAVREVLAEAEPLPRSAVMLAAAVSGAEPGPAASAVSAETVSDPPPPTYPTRLPPAATLQYDLRRGALSGQGSLQWRPGADGYELQIEGTVLGVAVLGWHSRGGTDGAGLAPQRFTDRRRGRDVRAANFQRDKGLITYSGASEQHRLLAGAQDRLSWMLQLAAIVEAAPARFGNGVQVPMQVSGARGDADIWTFVGGGAETVTLSGARIERALVFRRQPRKPYDTQVEVWLDPARHHLPVRLKLSNGNGADALEFLLRPGS
ncbi:DUF3108 domain-containing protein [Pseudorhodoferax sp.]|uniref:DUF3108 domain-containing protein n=1 Tax=Pseudorhodoferax sp. TaxID=1993553 RepID=UPI002DD648F9|nr:DUF3108 domain-containing protein [Pseudorhodoferax sp.]